MKTSNNIGEFQKKIAEGNRTAIYDYFQKNPLSTRRQCAQDLGMNEVVVGRHAAAIRDGWKPSDESQVG